MAGSIELWGCMIIVFVIVAGMVVVIKLLLEFPGLLQWKCVYSEHEHERENVGPPYLRRDLELGRAQSPRVKHSLDKSSSRVMETEMVEMGSKSSQVHWSPRNSEHDIHHQHDEGNHHERGHHHHHHHHHQDRANHHERSGRTGPGSKSSKETVVIAAEVTSSRTLKIEPSSPGIARQC